MRCYGVASGGTQSGRRQPMPRNFCAMQTLPQVVALGCLQCGTLLACLSTSTDRSTTLQRYHSQTEPYAAVLPASYLRNVTRLVTPQHQTSPLLTLVPPVFELLIDRSRCSELHRADMCLEYISQRFSDRYQPTHPPWVGLHIPPSKHSLSR